MPQGVIYGARVRQLLARNLLRDAFQQILGGLHADIGGKQQRFELFKQAVIERAAPEQQIAQAASKAALSGGKFFAQAAEEAGGPGGFGLLRMTEFFQKDDPGEFISVSML